MEEKEVVEQVQEDAVAVETPVEQAEETAQQAVTVETPAEQTEQAEQTQQPAETQSAETVETESAETQNEPEQPSLDFMEVKKLIHAHYVNVVSYLKYNKDKDANVNKLTKQMNAYRDGIETTMYKSLAINVIGYREACKKSLRDLETRALTADEIKKYLGYLYMDFQDLLTDLGVEEKGNKWFYNGKDLGESVAKAPVNTTIPEVSYQPLPVMDLRSLDDIAEYLKASEQLIQETLKTNAVLDKTLGEYIEYCGVYEKGAYQVALYPVVRKLVRMGMELKMDCADLSPDVAEEDCKIQYVKTLEYAVEQTEDILALCNVVVESEGLDVYDGKKHRMLKAIKTEDDSLNGVVANKYSDCYLMDEKVIYPSKVDVYRK